MEGVVNTPKSVGRGTNTENGNLVWFPCGRGSGRSREINNNVHDVGNSVWKNLNMIVHSPGCRTSPPPSSPPPGCGDGDADSMIVEDCPFCLRPIRNIICRACGNTFKGRVRGMCIYHPTVIHLMDSEACPKCKAYQLREFPDTNQN